MTAGSWVYMITVWAIIIGLNVFCFARILRNQKNRG